MGLLDIRLGCRLIRCSPFLGHPGNCNILENVYAITYIFVLQLSVLLLCNKHYDWETIMNNKYMKAVMKYVDVLVDGEFIEELKDVNYPWAGSTNQRVIDVQKSLKEGKVILHESN